MVLETTVNWNRPKLDRLKLAYKAAVAGQEKTGDDVFLFEGQEYVIGYARYLIEYLGEKFR